MISPQPYPSSPSYQTVVSALLRMHTLTLDGKDESEEAESVRESMGDHWESLSDVEQERVMGLSEDLYEISDRPDRAPEPMNPQAQGKLNEAYESRERGERDRALGLFRRWGKYVPAPLISYLRGTVWPRPAMRQRPLYFSSTPPSSTLTKRTLKPYFWIRWKWPILPKQEGGRKRFFRTARQKIPSSCCARRTSS